MVERTWRTLNAFFLCMHVNMKKCIEMHKTPPPEPETKRNLSKNAKFTKWIKLRVRLFRIFLHRQQIDNLFHKPPLYVKKNHETFLNKGKKPAKILQTYKNIKRSKKTHHFYFGPGTSVISKQLCNDNCCSKDRSIDRFSL